MVNNGILLRALEDTDLEELQTLLNNSHSQQLVGGSVVPLSKTQVMEWIEKKRAEEGTYFFAIESKKEFCGYIQLVDTNKADGFATLGINLLEKCQGKGIGSAAIEHLHGFARERLLLRKIILYVRSDNKSAIRIYHRLGYQEVGFFSGHLKSLDGYVDLKIMEVML